MVPALSAGTSFLDLTNERSLTSMPDRKLQRFRPANPLEPVTRTVFPFQNEGSEKFPPLLSARLGGPGLTSDKVLEPFISLLAAGQGREIANHFVIPNRIVDSGVTGWLSGRTSLWLCLGSAFDDACSKARLRRV